MLINHPYTSNLVGFFGVLEQEPLVKVKDLSTIICGLNLVFSYNNNVEDKM